MRILFDSKQLLHKDPLGTLTPNEKCTLNIHIPATVQATAVECVINRENGTPEMTVPLTYHMKKGAYEIFRGSFFFEERGLYFYYFRITTRTGSFRLFKQGDDTNMEAGASWRRSAASPRIALFPSGPWAPPCTRFSPTGSARQARWI